MLTFPAPASVNGALLADQFAAAGLSVAVKDVRLTDSVLELLSLDESNREAAQRVVDAHAPTADSVTKQLQTEQANETTVRDKAAQALVDNKAFLALTSPTNAQTAAQVKALTRQNNGLIRLMLRRFDAAD